MRLIDADRLLSDRMKSKYYHLPNGDVAIPLIDVEHAPTVGGWINNYEWICPTCGSSILIKTSKQSKAIGMKLSVCPVCGKEILYGKTD